jgi:rare lipoprotein A
MYVPATPAQAAPALAPVGILSTAPATLAAPVETSLRVRSSHLNVLDDSRVTVTGALLEDHQPGERGLVVSLQALGRRGWHTLTRTRTGAKGRFHLNYMPRQDGSQWVRLRFSGNNYMLSSHRRLGQLNVFRLAVASWYGGGGEMACGGELTSSTLGVANKTLPCGTRVTLRYGDHELTVPVVDRGPYVAGREFDLTEATKLALGFGDTGEVWSTR